ncbi:hypothetical protein [Mycolicibacterium sp. XJ870]
MTAGTSAKSGWRHWLPPAVATDLPVLAMLTLASLTVPVFWAHLATGLALIAVVAVHLSTRPRRPLRGLRAGRRFAYAVFLVVATVTAATGLLRWAGVPPEYVWHGGISYLLLGLVVVHLWWVRRVLRSRSQRRGVNAKGEHRE